VPRSIIKSDPCVLLPSGRINIREGIVSRAISFLHSIETLIQCLFDLGQNDGRYEWKDESNHTKLTVFMLQSRKQFAGKITLKQISFSLNANSI